MLGAVAGDAGESSRLDRFLAIAAGPANWRNDRQPTSADLAAGCAELTALGAILTVSVTAAGARDLGPGWLPYLLVGVLGVVLLVIAGPTAWWVFDRAGPGERTWFVDIRPVAAGRTLGFVGVVGLWAVLVGGPRMQDAWLFGVVLGCEATLGARSIGARMQPWRWWGHRLVSLGHLLLGAAAVALAVGMGGRHGAKVAVCAYIAVHFAVVAGVLECWVLERIRGRLDTELVQYARDIEQHQHRQRAHWLHDDVCSELRLLRLQLETQHLEPADVAAQLDELDHRLRVRQLDELLQSGRVRLAEVIQPFVRRAQAHGLRMREVPRFEQASLEMDEHTGRLVQRAAAVLMTNAIQAGATELSIRAVIDRDAGQFELWFDDDAGGFEHHAILPGRGLDSLRHDLGPGSLELRRTDVGTSARVVFALESIQETT
jgi:hypothetical protein